MFNKLLAAIAVVTVVSVTGAAHIDTTAEPLTSSFAHVVTTGAGRCEALTADGECAASRIVGGNDVCPPFRYLSMRKCCASSASFVIP